ncbi:hypothetical protein QZM22_06705 [Burkholderia oklahomensis]|uniref:hypothetical protein n=1 Tax=Burkholderia oklahomensis TaxID=342113 RepID=UPI00264FF725|nr:hypothetical protein [Burkholderia oklahomensis]MDN7672216.1 hypothetical protein [Burkholderia oklahomensis]
MTLRARPYPSATAALVRSAQYQDADGDFSGAADREGKHDRLDSYGGSPRFLRTATGVNVSPTKNMRELESSFSVENGDAALIDGLTQDKTTRIDSGLS